MAIEFIGCSNGMLRYYPEHNHPCSELIYNTQGSGKMIIGTETIPFQPGTIVLIPPHVPHVKYADAGTDYKDMYLQISGLRLFKHTLCFMDDSEQSFYALFNMAYRHFHRQDTETVEALWNVMLRLILQYQDTDSRFDEIERFKNTLIDHISDPDFNISDAIQNTHYCADHFRRIFKQQLGMPPIQYLHNLRINYAKSLLKQKESIGCSMNDIAFMCGFYDYAYFTRLFKKITGCSPQDYIKTCK